MHWYWLGVQNGCHRFHTQRCFNTWKLVSNQQWHFNSQHACCRQGMVGVVVSPHLIYWINIYIFSLWILRNRWNVYSIRSVKRRIVYTCSVKIYRSSLYIVLRKLLATIENYAMPDDHIFWSVRSQLTTGPKGYSARPSTQYIYIHFPLKEFFTFTNSSTQLTRGGGDHFMTLISYLQCMQVGEHFKGVFPWQKEWY